MRRCWRRCPPRTLPDKTIGGHYASPDLGLPFHGYVAGGAEDDHEGTRLEDAVERVRQGMKAMLRYGSAWHDVAAQVEAITTTSWTPATSSCAPTIPTPRPSRRKVTWTGSCAMPSRKVLTP